MVPEPFPTKRDAIASRACLCALFAALSLSLASCQDEAAFGMPAARLAEILAGKEAAPVLAISERDLESPGKLGADAYYYLGRWIEDKAPDASQAAQSLYRRAFDRSTGLVRREAARSLATALAKAGAHQELVAFSREHRLSEGLDWAVDRPALDAMRELGLDADLVDALDAMREAFPARSEEDADALLVLEAEAKRRLGKPGWSVPLRALLLERATTAWTAKALELLEASDPPDPLLTAAEYRVARMRASVFGKDYGAAYREAAPVLDFALSPRSSPQAIADAGKAFLYSGMAKQGMELFASLESRAASEAARAPDPAADARRVAWNALFYRARFALSLRLWPEARELFRLASARAPGPEDADAALWYGIDAASKAAGDAAKDAKARRAVLDALAEAAPSWNAPERFADLVDGLFRQAIQARDWELVNAIGERLAGRLPSAIGARVSYVAARAVELGLFVPAKSDARGTESIESESTEKNTLSRFLAIAADASAPLHYRALAAWRSSCSLDLLPPDLPMAKAPERLPEEEAFILGFMEFGLAGLAADEARARIETLEPDSIRRIAAALVTAGRADGSVRLAAAFMASPYWAPRRSDYELLYPRPYLSDYRAIRPRPSCPEQLFYGLLRSESLFRPDISSRAGAVGLAQLMPPTAAEVASSLDLEDYDLEAPRDNLRIGAAFFSELLDETGRPLRAMMAYNAGRGRLRAWTAEAGELPDDLMLEALGIAETRQYGRNILQASVMYGELYYDVPVAQTARLVVEGGEF